MGRFEVNTASDNFTDEKKKMAQKTNGQGAPQLYRKINTKRCVIFYLQ